MSQRANFQKNYLTRYLVLAGVCLPLALWFAYDGFIAYPKQLEMAREYDPLRDLTTEERQSRWDTITQEKGWPNQVPEKKAAEVADAIIGQYLWGSLSFIAGSIAMLYYLRSRGSWVESTPTGLTTSWGQKLDFKDVVRLDKKKWEAKGIARATYRDNTITRTFVFDDFKFDRAPLGQMLRALEKKLDREQIVGGPPEPPEEVASVSDPSEEGPSDPVS